MKNKIAVYLIVAAAACANLACQTLSVKSEGGEPNDAQKQKIVACGKPNLDEASKSDLLDASDQFAKAENFSCAEAMCDEFERRFSEHFARFECRGNVLFKQKQFAQALVYFDRLTEAKPTYSYGFLQRSFVQEELRNLNAASADADTAFRLIEAEAAHDETRTFASKVLVQRGYIQFLKGANESALKDFDRAVELNPESHLAYTARSFARRKLGQNALADDDEKRGKELKQASKENPNSI